MGSIWGVVGGGRVAREASMGRGQESMGRVKERATGTEPTMSYLGN